MEKVITPTCVKFLPISRYLTILMTNCLTRLKLSGPKLWEESSTNTISARVLLHSAIKETRHDNDICDRNSREHAFIENKNQLTKNIERLNHLEITFISKLLSVRNYLFCLYMQPLEPYMSSKLIVMYDAWLT